MLPHRTLVVDSCFLGKVFTEATIHEITRTDTKAIRVSSCNSWIAFLPGRQHTLYRRASFFAGHGEKGSSGV